MFDYTGSEGCEDYVMFLDSLPQKIIICINIQLLLCMSELSPASVQVQVWKGVFHSIGLAGML